MSIHRLNRCLVCNSEDPVWRRLINHNLTAQERSSLVTAIFSDCDQVNMVAHLSGDDAQKYIDVVDEVGPQTIPCPTRKYF